MTTPIQSLTLTEEQQALRDVARRFLSDRLGTDVVRTIMDGDEGFDPDHWAEVAAMGWQAMVVPDDLDGAGYGWTELAVLSEEVGRAVAPLPLLSTAMGTAVLLDHGNDDQRARLLPAVAAGQLRLAVAVPLDHGDQRDWPTLSGDRLSGRVRHVVDAAGADLVVVASPDGAMLVDPAADGVDVAPMAVMDQTRPQAELVLTDVVVDERDRLHGDPATVLDRARLVGAVLVANEQVGTAAAVHEMAVDHARTRKQFGRAIGSFQAIKHLLADDLVELEAARSTAWHAARALAADDRGELAVAAPMAASLCSEVAAKLAGDAIQVHGGIGFTWEHDAHLFFKRASSSRLLFGTPAAWRRRLADTLEL